MHIITMVQLRPCNPIDSHKNQGVYYQFEVIRKV